ncbi:hypothetical protein BDR07DRAFT_1497388 [Suillus spraguei]|nr:hypothetical protein BDR07DRAFT_1497388 [Suillus spraguei]
MHFHKHWYKPRKKQEEECSEQARWNVFEGLEVTPVFKDVLHAVAKFMVCDDQSLAVANKATFRNCLVAMWPAAMKVDIPSMHNITTYIHNAFLDFFVQLKSDIQSANSGRISTTTDLWSIDQAKAAFFGLTAHWIEVDNATGRWTLWVQVIAFKGSLGAHSGDNFGCYFIGLCECA